MNIVAITGRISSEVEIKQTQTGSAIVNIQVAVRRPYNGGKQDTDFLPAKAFGKTAEYIGKYFAKGDMIAIDGWLGKDEYIGNDGAKRSSYNICIDHASFCSNRPSTQNNVGGDTTSYQQSVTEPQTLQDYSFDGELPF